MAGYPSANPFALVERAQQPRRGGRGRGRGGKINVEYMRRMAPDWDELDAAQNVEYKVMAQTDARFEATFPMPPLLEETCSLQTHTSGVDAITWFGDYIIAGGHDGNLQVLSMGKDENGREELRCRKTLAKHTPSYRGGNSQNGHRGGVYTCAASSDLAAVVSGGSGAEISDPGDLLVWTGSGKDLGSSVTALNGHDSAVYSAVFAGAGSTRVMSSNRGGDLLLHDLNRPRSPLVAKRFVHAGIAHSVSAHVSSPDVFFSAGADGHLRTGDFRVPEDRFKSFWSLPSTSANYQYFRSAEGIENAHSHEAIYAIAHVNEHMLISGGADYKMKTWDLRKPTGADCGSCAREFLGHLSSVRGLCLAGDRRFVSACEDGSLRVWPTKRPPHVAGTKKQDHIGASCILDGHKSLVAAAACRGNYVATASWDQTVRVFDLSSLA